VVSFFFEVVPKHLLEEGSDALSRMIVDCEVSNFYLKLCWPHTRKHTHKHTQTHTRTHRNTHTQNHTHTNTHNTHTNTHTHTHKPHALLQDRIAAKKLEAAKRRAAGGSGRKVVVASTPAPTRVRGSGLTAKQCGVLEGLRAHDCLGLTKDLVPCLGPDPMKTSPCSTGRTICRNCAKGYKSCEDCKKSGVWVSVFVVIFFNMLLL